MSSPRRPMRAAFVAAAAVAASVLALVGVARAQEGTTWSQYQGGASHAGLAEDGPEPPFRVRWTLPAPAGIALSAAVVEGDVAITVGEEAVYGVDVASGDVSWQIPRAGGPLSMPALGEESGRRVVVYLEGPTGTGSQASTGSPTASPSPSGTTSGTTSPSESPSGATEQTERISSVVAAGLGDKHGVLWRTPLEDVSRSGVTIEGGSAYV